MVDETKTSRSTRKNGNCGNKAGKGFTRIQKKTSFA